MEESEGNVYQPEFPFGFGLSYTQFNYSDLKLSSDQINAQESLEVSVTVTNTGPLEGKEVVQLYLTDLYASVARPVKQLKSFSKITLKPNESKEVHLKLKPSDFSFIGRDLQRTIEPGEFKIQVGTLQKSFQIVSQR
jgi:beta-glucosidase